MEEAILMLLTGKRFTKDTGSWEISVEFRATKSVYWKRVIDRKNSTVIEGKLSGILVTQQGFKVLLGAHTVNGRSQLSGELLEFCYLGKSLLVRNPDGTGYLILDPMK